VVNPLVDDSQSGYITKFIKINFKKKNPNHQQPKITAGQLEDKLSNAVS
jgi:hypothetical protein